ncbi:hypothetical protein TIFTF001_051939 [Ficus carica]|uniref:Uncharacterized protein n=1 Tax=Ficus carica TaxID=3494 RepID=A0AA88EJH3_FICCA|nr:hypothetical protein TIFTF001_051939 [Ficus carica]
MIADILAPSAVYISRLFTAPKKIELEQKIKETKAMAFENSKLIRKSDIEDRLAVPQRWMNLWRPLFENGKTEAVVRVFCSLGYGWEFRCAIRGIGQYDKPVLQAPEWQRFVKYTGLQEGDKLILQEVANHQRGMNYHIKVQRKGVDGFWADVQPPEHAAPTFYQFII